MFYADYFIFDPKAFGFKTDIEQFRISNLIFS